MSEKDVFIVLLPYSGIKLDDSNQVLHVIGENLGEAHALLLHTVGIMATNKRILCVTSTMYNLLSTVGVLNT